MTKKITLFILPIIIFIDIVIFSSITELLRQPSDIAVIAGVVLICAALVLNFYLIKFIQKQFKTKTK